MLPVPLHDLVFLPPWQVLLAMAGLAYLLQQKWHWSRNFLNQLGVGECSFCFGLHLGAFTYVGAVLLRQVFAPIPAVDHFLVGPWVTLGLHVLSLLLWVFGAGVFSLLLDKVTDR